MILSDTYQADNMAQHVARVHNQGTVSEGLQKIFIRADAVIFYSFRLSTRRKFLAYGYDFQPRNNVPG